VFSTVISDFPKVNMQTPLDQTSRLRSLAIAFIIAIGILGCDRERGATGDAPATSSAAQAAPETPGPGYIIGRITRPDGSPLAIEGTKFTVLIPSTRQSGESIETRRHQVS
jgi:hypothetical protein